MNSKYFFMLAIVFSLFLTSCGSDNESLFTIEMETDLNIGAGLNNVETHFFILRAVPTQINSYLASRNVSKEAIGRVLASRASLRGRFSDIDFRIIEKISIWVISRDDETLKREAFFLDFVPNNQSGDLKLFSSISEVKEILLDDLIDIEIRVKLRAITPTNIETRLSLSFEAFAVE
jgi:hypothetical protein